MLLLTIFTTRAATLPTFIWCIMLKPFGRCESVRAIIYAFVNAFVPTPAPTPSL